MTKFWLIYASKSRQGGRFSKVPLTFARSNIFNILKFMFIILMFSISFNPKEIWCKMKLRNQLILVRMLIFY